MTHEEQRNMYTGILGTVAIHLVILVLFLAVKLNKVRTAHQEHIVIEFTEDDYKTIEQIIKDRQQKTIAIPNLSHEELSNIASNVNDKFQKEISTEDYEKQIMEELGMEEINPHYDNTLPDDPMVIDKTEKPKEPVSHNFGKTRVTYKVNPYRKARYLKPPIYLCQGGGTVVVNIKVNPEGEVFESQISSSSTNDECIHQMAINSASETLFNIDNNAPKTATGTITYIFVPQ